jgi:hypothetical protein
MKWIALILQKKKENPYKINLKFAVRKVLLDIHNMIEYVH